MERASQEGQTSTIRATAVERRPQRNSGSLSKPSDADERAVAWIDHFTGGGLSVSCGCKRLLLGLLRVAGDESPVAIFECPHIDDNSFGGDWPLRTMGHFVACRLALLTHPGFHDSCRAEVDFPVDPYVEPVPRYAAAGIGPLLFAPSAVRQRKNPDHAVADAGLDELSVMRPNGVLQALQPVKRVPRILVFHRTLRSLPSHDPVAGRERP